MIVGILTKCRYYLYTGGTVLEAQTVFLYLGSLNPNPDCVLTSKKQSIESIDYSESTKAPNSNDNFKVEHQG